MANAAQYKMIGGTPTSTGSSTPSPKRMALQRPGVSWTDDLPVCKLSDIGIVPNAVYLQGGRTMETHQYSDYSFNFRSENGCLLYGLFDGHDGVKAAHFASSRLPAELLLGQINPSYNPPDSSIRKVLYQSFSIVERGFFESIDDALAKRTYLQSQITERVSTETASKRHRETVARIKNLDNEIKGGTTAVVALIVNGKLFVANVGECRALICQLNTQSSHLEVQQLSVDHNIYQAQEIARLQKLGLNVEKVQNRGKLGINECTRCIGDYAVKGGYKDIDYLRYSASEPSISEPSITEGIIIDEYPGSFLILMSDDLYKSIQQCVANIDPNDYIAQLTSRELLLRRTIEGVAQIVVEKIAYLHRQTFGHQPMTCRGDMTLIVRNFTHPVGVTITGVDEYPVSVPYDGLPTNDRSNIRLVMPNPALSPNQYGGRFPGSYSSGTPSDDTPINLESGATSGVETGTDMQTGYTNRTHSLLVEEQDDFNGEDFYRCDNNETLQQDTDGRIRAYIKFDSFFEHHPRANSSNKR